MEVSADPTAIGGQDDADAPPAEPWVRYSMEWRDRGNRVVKRQDVTAGYDHSPKESKQPETSNALPVFEKVSVLPYRASPAVQNPAYLDVSPSSDSDSYSESHFRRPADHLRIFSAAIIDVLRHVVRYYPQQGLNRNIVKIHWPYPVLVHHYDKLVQVRDERAGESLSDLCVREKDLVRHLYLLIKFLDDEVMGFVRAEQARHQKGFFTFEHVWVAMKPGTTIFHRVRDRQEDDEWEAGVIESLSGGVFTQPSGEWELQKWSMAYNGVYLGRERSWFRMKKFDGEAAFESHCIRFLGLQDFAYPPETGPIREAIEHGRTYWDLVGKRCMYHEGMTVGSLPRKHVRLHLISVSRPC